jgi:hypothetical protein
MSARRNAVSGHSAIAIGETVPIELPLAALCYLLAHDAENVLRRRTVSGNP